MLAGPNCTQRRALFEPHADVRHEYQGQNHRVRRTEMPGRASRGPATRSVRASCAEHHHGDQPGGTNRNCRMTGDFQIGHQTVARSGTTVAEKVITAPMAHQPRSHRDNRRRPAPLGRPGHASRIAQLGLIESVRQKRIAFRRTVRRLIPSSAWEAHRCNQTSISVSPSPGRCRRKSPITTRT